MKTEKRSSLLEPKLGENQSGRTSTSPFSHPQLRTAALKQQNNDDADILKVLQCFFQIYDQNSLADDVIKNGCDVITLI